MNAWIPFRTLFVKEVVRFLKVWRHTILAPILTSFLYLVVFGEALSKHLPVYEGVSYTAFITGPSRTADIERVGALGVHGPLELHIVLLED